MAKTGRPRTGFPAVPITAIGDVTCGTHTLGMQATRVMSLTNRVLRRLHNELRANPNGLPSPAWLETFRYIAPTIVALLREQRERSRGTEQPPMTDVEFAAGMRELAEDAVLAMSADELADLLKRRGEAS